MIKEGKEEKARMSTNLSQYMTPSHSASYNEIQKNGKQHIHLFSNIIDIQGDVPIENSKHI